MKTKVIILIYKGNLKSNLSVFKNAIVCSDIRQANMYLIQKGFVREDSLPKKKQRKNIPEDEDSRLYVNTKKSKIAGIIKDVEYIG